MKGSKALETGGMNRTKLVHPSRTSESIKLVLGQQKFENGLICRHPLCRSPVKPGQTQNKIELSKYKKYHLHSMTVDKKDSFEYPLNLPKLYKLAER